MKRTFSLLLFALFLLMTKAASANTWYVRPDGGTRYSANMTSGQCDGLGDVAYSGVGTNQHCAFNDYRYLYQDGSYNTMSSFPAWGWVIAGGDTVIIRGSIGSGVSYRVGWNNPNSSCESDGCWGVQGNPYVNGNPLIPAGTATNPTRILGENYGSCSAASAKTQLHGGYGTEAVLDMGGASYVDVECLDLTDFSNCSLEQGASIPCQKGTPLSDFAHIGVNWTNTSSHDTLNNVTIHGLAGGMAGPTGDGVVMTNLDIHGNSDAGWNSDTGAGDASALGVGSVLIQNFNISWNGCAEEYPIVDALPYYECLDDSSGGYGDGFGTATVQSTQPWNVHFDQGTVSYNTQDGLDALHLVGAGSSMTITRVNAFGNEGQQIKVGGAHGTAQNNIITTNCNALREQIPGTPVGYNSKLSDLCRAADAGILVTVGKGATTLFDNNTIYSAAATGINLGCDGTNGPCDNTTLIDFRDNIFLGFLNNPADGYTAQTDLGTGDYSNPIYDGTGMSISTFANPGSLFSNNLFFHGKSNFNCSTVGQTSGLCVDPQLTDETWHNYGYANVKPLAGSPVIGVGAAVSSVLTDFTGATRPNPSSLGAVEGPATGSQSTTPTTPTTPTAPTTPTTPTTPITPITPVTPTSITTQATLTATKGPSAQTPLVLTATVKSLGSSKVPTGNVIVFTSNHWPIAVGVLNTSGSVTWTVPAALANLSVYVSYTGKSNFKSSVSSTLNEASAMASLY